MRLKKQLFNQCIVPVMSNGAQSWTTTKRLEKKLRVTERAMERIVRGVTRKDKVRNQDLRNSAGVLDIIQVIKQRSGDEQGIQLDHVRIRDGGRQSRRWMDDMREYGGVT
ncbi:endonuclease-reverse transcriptase [Apostichopus japonicus]|uniref:Endonuclease-reverse transcriptase n=1 Tax=Stichopus japonicus TaxID=307972 RepID=A0A2G8KTM1_STIJA|nr:endonuclease-reverse transcriptase [Apostichopus japonicus]